MNLKYLELVHHEHEVVRSHLQDLHDMLSHTPLLEELHFYGSGVCAESRSCKCFVMLNKLHILTIAQQVSSHDVVTLIHSLRAPNLINLTTSKWQ